MPLFRHVTVGDAITNALEELDWSETRLAREARIDRAAMHKIIDGRIGLGRKRAERIVEAIERGGGKISLEVLLQPVPKDVQRLLEQAEAVSLKLDEARLRLQAAATPEEHRERDQSP